MTDPLRPSKFGAGYTYTGTDRTTQPGPVPPTAPTAPPAYPPTAYPTQNPPPYTATPYPVSPANFQAIPAGASQSATGSPSGVTAIIAAMLALLGGALRAYLSIGLVQGLYYLSQISGDLGAYFDNSAFAWVVIYTVASLAATAALLIGGILLLSRKRAGRGFIVLGCLIVIAESVVSLVAVASFMQTLGSFSGGSLGGTLNIGATTAISVAVPVVTMILALLPSTSRWCR